ncbi:glycoside hydrolase family 43 protein [Alicyclobacillus ferrooxydans]|uniref:Glycoside hydrolase n=1 Tax=Alicyclobacillus ferrooxydans TaxID=471514 RepID=A0A0P9CZE6_9BACL|nr:glycoside hydrolase family 43 protein [Alicyclobacillus ferrooxydans]KPV42443.1 hypothetical protein AN477_17800 [Alicyclobacillus ferrooxydans]
MIRFGTRLFGRRSIEIRNPVLSQDSPDPFVLSTQDGYFLYHTGVSPDGKHAIPIYRSEDLKTWRFATYAISIPSSFQSWNRYDFWAPEVIRLGTSYYLYYTASADGTVGTRHLGVAWSRDPSLPFQDAGKSLLPWQSIDGHPFIDDDGTLYLFFCMDQCNAYSAGSIYVVRMNDPTTFSNEPVLAMSTPRADKWEEGPFVLKVGPTYFLMYSCGDWRTESYHIEYAIADNPLGPYRRIPTDENPDALLCSNDFAKGPGHHCVIKSPNGEDYILIYHGWAADFVGGRLARIEKLKVEGGRLKSTGPSLRVRV